jgi:hypothetical protein
MKSCHEVPFKVPQQRSEQINKWPQTVTHHATRTSHFLDMTHTRLHVPLVTAEDGAVLFNSPESMKLGCGSPQTPTC